MNRVCMLLLGCALLLPAAGSKAQDVGDIQSGVGIVCDTKAQIERLLVLAESEPRAALGKVNTEAGQVDACVVAPVIYIPGAKVAQVTNGLGSFDVVEILVVGIATPQGPQVFTSPVVWFTVIQSEGNPV